MPNALTRHVGLNAGTWVLETLFKHYFDQLFPGKVEEMTRTSDSTGDSGDLRRDELMYAEVFHIVKSFLDASTHHTVEELQQFSNTRTPSAPWMFVKRLLVPMSCCDEAATYVIDVLGGEQKTRELVGGTKWWQVRGLKGVDAQWIVARKDYELQRRRRKEREQAGVERKDSTEANGDEPVTNPELADLKCILFLHGGGYYFGSVDQERYFIQRLARKSGCRCLAINYRLAPQYPFPCALQDALAAYLYLIRPPKEAPHAAISPSDIVISGDSAGGGLTIALLQVLRDTGLPLPAGGIPISPWCDLTHSFPSIHINTDTDVIPKYGLSMYRPSALWPPPSDDMTEKIHSSLRSRIREAALHTYKSSDKVKRDLEKRPSFWKKKFSFGVRRKSHSNCKRSQSVPRSRSTSFDETELDRDDVRVQAVSKSINETAVHDGNVENNLDLGTSASIPKADRTDTQTLSVVTESGEELVVNDQVHLYTVNNMLTHPLVSPAYAYLGGLPPLLVIASDHEVLRDEIIYMAHRAAHPDRYPVSDDSRRLYPKMEGIELRYGPTDVHLQVYDQTAHILPILFGFCTPAKFCFRALASFNRYAWGVPHPSPSKQNSLETKQSTRKLAKRSASTNSSREAYFFGSQRRRSSLAPGSPEIINGDRQIRHRRSESDSFLRRSFSRRSRRSSVSTMERLEPIASEVVQTVRFAGDPSIYKQHPTPFIDHMIRERVSIKGQIRPLEPEDELPACNMPPGRLGMANELCLRRYLEGKAKWDERYGHVAKRVFKKRARNLALAKKETVRNVTQLQMHFFQDNISSEMGEKGLKEGLKSAASWAWAWALDGLENPPPSSIVARRDTEEARRLSKIADEPNDDAEHPLSANNLWSYLFSRLGSGSEKEEAARDKQKQDGVDEELGGLASSPKTRRAKTLFISRRKGAPVPRRYASASSVPRRVESVPELEEETNNKLARIQSS